MDQNMSSFLEVVNQGQLLNYVPPVLRTLFIIYLILKAMDFISGMLKVWKLKNYKSSKMRDGIIKFVADLISLVLVLIVDITLGINFYLSGATLAVMVYKEIGSNMENLKACGVTFIPAVQERLETLSKGEIPPESMQIKKPDEEEKKKEE